MDERQRIQTAFKVKRELKKLNFRQRREMLWQLLADEISGKPLSVNWLLEQVGKLIDEEGRKLISRFKK